MLEPDFKATNSVGKNKRDVLRAAKEASQKVLLKLGAMIEREAKVSMRKGGRVAGKKKGVPAPRGKPPHVQTGNLRASITHALTSEGTVVVGPTRMAFYGKYQEDPKKLDRPFMVPAKDKVMRTAPKEWRQMAMGKTPTGRKLNSKKD